MYKKISAQRFGASEELALVEIDQLPEPGPEEIRIRVEAAGVGYTDTILRRGRYVAYTGGLPATPGYDVVGTVDAVGPNVTDLVVGQRIADMPVAGSYSQYLVRPADMAIPVPDGVAPEIAVELPLMGMTAWQMLTRSARLSAGDAILVVGASGGVGRALVALGRHLGLTVIGTSSAVNIVQLEALGTVALDYRRAQLSDAIRTASGGAGVAAAFDAIGGDSWEISFAALAPGGVLVGYGLQDFIETGTDSADAMRQIARINQGFTAEGEADGTGRRGVFYDINLRRGSLPGEYRADMEALLGLVASGAYAPPMPESLPLAAAADAHRRIAAGGLDHRLVLDPWR